MILYDFTDKLGSTQIETLHFKLILATDISQDGAQKRLKSCYL